MSGLQPEHNDAIFLNRTSEPVPGPSSRTVVLPIEHKDRVIEAFDSEVKESKPLLTPRAAELLQNAHVLIQNFEYSLAQNLLREVLNRNSHCVPAIRAMILCCRQREKMEEAERLLRVLVALDGRAEDFIELAHILYVRRSDHEALKYYLMALRMLPTDESQLFEVYKNIGNIFVRSHDFESAEDNYNKAYTLKPNSDALLVNYGTLEIQRGDLAKAVERFRAAVEIAPANDRAWVGLAIVHRQFGDIDLSWANIERALDANPTNETAIQLGLSWVVKDMRWAVMIDRLKRYLARSSADVGMSLALAQLYYLAGRFAEARIEIERSLALDPEVRGGVDLLELIRNEESKARGAMT